MRSVLPGLVLALALGLVAASLAAAPRVPVGSTVLRASAVSFNLNYSDPASDVFKLWSSNGSHVTDANGFWLMSPFPGEVNLIRLGSSATGTDINLFVRVQTTIASRSNVTYEIRMYSRADNRTHYVLDYSNGAAALKQNRSGTPIVDMSSNVTISPASTLNAVVSKALLGGTANITSWNIDATSKEIGTTYSYEDYVWQQPGNPGSSPADIQGRVTDAATGEGLAGVNVSASVGGYYTTTNATGYYSLPAAPGNFSLTFSLSGYATGTKAVSVQYQQTQTVNEQLSKNVGLSGSMLWILVAVVVVAAVVIAVVVVQRRSRSSKSAKRPPESGKP